MYVCSMTCIIMYCGANTEVSCYRHMHNEKMASNIEVVPGGPIFCLYLLSERYKDSLRQESCALKNETVLCENQGDRLCHF